MTHPLITDTDIRRWQYAAIEVLTDITADARGITPITWQVSVTAQIQGEPGSGTHSERMASLWAWSDHLGITMRQLPGSDGLVTYWGRTERTARNGMPVSVSLYMRVWPEED